MPSPPGKIALIGEARGEFLFLRMVAEQIRAIAGAESAIQVELDPRDLSEQERRNCVVPALEPEFQAAMELPAAKLPGHVRQLERKFDIPNLRRLWRGDLQVWRDGVDEDAMARQAIGYLTVFDRMFGDDPDLVGGFAEESARLIKRAFRAVARHHGRRMLVTIGLPIPERVVFVDQENFTEYLPPYDEFRPAPEQMAAAARYAEQVRSSEVKFANPRDLSFDMKRLSNFMRLAWRSSARREPGSANAHLRFFAHDYVVQRMRMAAMNRFTDQAPSGDRSVFYPLHFVHDSNVTIRAEAYRDQIALIEYLAHSLPYGYRLWVKPHPAAAGDLPVSKLRGLERRIANVRVAHPSVPAMHLLKQVSAVVTLSSTTGFEALVLGKPVVTLGEAPYAYYGLTHNVRDPATLPRVLASVLSGDGPPIEAVERLIAYYMAIGHQLTPSWVEPGRRSATQYAEALANLFGLAATSSPLTAISAGGVAPDNSGD